MTTKRMIMISLFAAMLAISVFIFPPIPIPVIDVNFTLQTLFVIMIGYLLSPIDAFLSVFIYVLMGAIGLPVFSGMRGGLSILFGPTGGFIFLFPIVSFLIAYTKSKTTKVWHDLLIGFVWGILFLYLGATLWLSFSININYFKALITMLIFVPFDMLKILLAYIIARRIPKQVIY